MYIYDALHNILIKVLDEWKEEEHPRDEKGRFSTSFGAVVAHKTEQESGASFNLKLNQPEKGYMVVVHSDRGEKYHFGKMSAPVRKKNLITAINRFSRKNEDLLQESDDIYVGTWYDSDTDELYLDISTNVHDKKEAMRIGKERNEIAIWDVEAADEIRL